MSRMLVTLPVVDAKAPSVKAEGVNGLQEGAIGVAGMNPEFDNHAWLQRADQPNSKWYVPDPRRWLDKPGGILKFKAARRSRQHEINSSVFVCLRHQCRPRRFETALKRSTMVGQNPGHPSRQFREISAPSTRFPAISALIKAFRKRKL